MSPSILNRAFVDTRSTIGPGVTSVTFNPGNRVESAPLSHSGARSSLRVSGTEMLVALMVSFGSGGRCGRRGRGLDRTTGGGLLDALRSADEVAGDRLAALREQH